MPFIINHRNLSLGFTLTELLVTVTVLGILASIATPSMRSFIQSNRLTAAGNDLLADINTARSEALKRQGGTEAGMVGKIVVCVSSSGLDCTAGSNTWNSGWIVFWDQDSSGTFATANNDVMLKTHPALPTGMTTTTTPANTLSISYNALGMLESGAVTGVQVTNTVINKSRVVCVSATGQATVRTTCP